jgi:hypothetical protein
VWILPHTIRYVALKYVNTIQATTALGTHAFGHDSSRTQAITTGITTDTRTKQDSQRSYSLQATPYRLHIETEETKSLHAANFVFLISHNYYLLSRPACMIISLDDATRCCNKRRATLAAQKRCFRHVSYNTVNRNRCATSWYQVWAHIYKKLYLKIYYHIYSVEFIMSHIKLKVWNICLDFAFHVYSAVRSVITIPHFYQYLSPHNTGCKCKLMYFNQYNLVLQTD